MIPKSNRTKNFEYKITREVNKEMKKKLIQKKNVYKYVCMYL
jgi:hypothetical protein